MSRLTAVIDLDEPIRDTPRRIARISERDEAGSGASTYEYLKDLDRGLALPIRRIREYAGYTAAELTDLLGAFHPPQGYLLVNNNPGWMRVCHALIKGKAVREMTVDHRGTDT